MHLLTCPACGEVTEVDDEELVICDSVGLLLCPSCESPLRCEADIEHAMDEEVRASGRETRGTALSAELVSELTEAVEILTDQVRCLRLAIDEIEAELGWAIRTRVIPRFESPVLTDPPVLPPKPLEAASSARSPLPSSAKLLPIKEGNATQGQLWK